MNKMTLIKRGVLATAMIATLGLTACDKKAESAAQVESATTEKGHETEALLNGYSNMAYEAYGDSLEGAKKLQSALEKFVSEPTQANLDAAKAVYKDARQPYSQTEIFRFDEGFVAANDKRGIESVDSWEGQLNAWPLDEALIDYVSDSYEGEYSEKNNIINSKSITIGSDTKDTTKITPELLADMNEIGGSEANVASGYHAIEFLLWGQDLNGTAEGAGKRPVTDYSTDHTCTSGAVTADVSACQRRGEYLKAAAQLLVTDLEAMVAEWKPDSKDTLRSDLLARAGDNAVRQIMYQMGSLALGELASERMQVAFVTGSTEDEHECFSDLTHLSYAMNAQGIKNVFEGSYNGSKGYGIKQYLIDMGQQEVADNLQAQFDDVATSFDTIVDQGENKGVKVDQMIATVGQAAKHGVEKVEQEKRRAWINDAITKLQVVTSGIETAAASLGMDKLDADGGSNF